MEEKTKKFIRKIRFDSYIYTLTFLVIALSYFLVYDVRTEPLMLLLAAFAFYTMGKQVRLITELEEGADIDTRPRAPLWVRFVTYVVIIFAVAKFMFS